MDGVRDKEFTNKWLELEMAKCPSFIMDRLGRDFVGELVREAVELNMGYCNDDDFGRRIFERCKVLGTGSEDYKYRHLQTRLGGIITSIRFIGGDMGKPAVFLIHKDFELDSIRDIREIGELVSKEYAVFKPQRIRWYSTEMERDLIGADDSVAGDLVYVTEFVENLRAKPFPGHYDAVSLTEAKTLHWYGDYVSAFEDIYKKWPSFVEMAQVESRETLNELIGKKLLFDIRINGKWAGIIAADQGTEQFMKGYYIVEELLTEEFRGRHYAAAVQRHLIQRLPYGNNEMLFGTIHYDNIPSLKTAFSVGRKAVGMYVFAGI